MKAFVSVLTIATSFLLSACDGGGGKSAPTDSKGKTPEATFLTICELLIDGKSEEAKAYYSAKFLEEFVTKPKTTFEAYTADIAGWQKSWLKAESMGNKYNVDVWRVKMIPDQGKGSGNRPGAVYDFAVIDGGWKVVFWNHYPKS